MSNEFNYENAYDELSIIISQQEIIQQKTSVLMAINIALLGVYVTFIFSFAILWWISAIIIAYLSIPILINIKILYPGFGNKSKDNGKYFYDFAEMNSEELESWMNKNKDNVFKQIIINSNITKTKYILFRKSMKWTFLFFIPIFIFWAIELVKKNNP